MKRLFLLLWTLVFAFPACADDKPIAAEQLPTTAREFIDTHFGQTKIMLTTVDKELFYRSYTVTFQDGAKIEFDKKGEWKDIECKNGVPEAIVPDKIREYIRTQFPGRTIQSIDRDRNDYEVKLDHDFDLKFDRAFNLVSIGD